MKLSKNITQYLKMSNLDKSLPKWAVFIMVPANSNQSKKINTLMWVKQDTEKSFHNLLCSTSHNKTHCLSCCIKLLIVLSLKFSLKETKNGFSKITAESSMKSSGKLFNKPIKKDFIKRNSIIFSI